MTSFKSSTNTSISNLQSDLSGTNTELTNFETATNTTLTNIENDVSNKRVDILFSGSVNLGDGTSNTDITTASTDGYDFIIICIETDSFYNIGGTIIFPEVLVNHQRWVTGLIAQSPSVRYTMQAMWLSHNSFRIWYTRETWNINQLYVTQVLGVKL